MHDLFLEDLSCKIIHDFGGTISGRITQQLLARLVIELCVHSHMTLLTRYKKCRGLITW